MTRKPAGLSPEYAAQFSDPSVVAAYHHRPPYPDEAFETIVSLLPPHAATVLDVGCGTGDIARPLAQRVARVDAVDISAPMIERGRTLPGGEAGNLHWRLGRVEDFALDRTYGAITAAESLHWMDWDVALPLLCRLLAPGGYLVILDRHEQPTPWSTQLAPLISRYSTNRDYVPYDLVDELVAAGLFAPAGSRRTHPVRYGQSIADYIESWHSRNGLSRDRMPSADAASFDYELHSLVSMYGDEGLLEIAYTVSLNWGSPLRRS